MLSLMASLFVVSKECMAVISDDERVRLVRIVQNIEGYSAQLEGIGLDDSVLSKFIHPPELNLPLTLDDLNFVFALFQREEQGQSVISRIPVPANGMNVVGDLHGKLGPTVVQTRNALDNHKAVLFLGDFVDRGGNSIEVTVYLLAKRLLYPEQVYVNRGDHETIGIMDLNLEKLQNTV